MEKQRRAAFLLVVSMPLVLPKFLLENFSVIIITGFAVIRIGRRLLFYK